MGVGRWARPLVIVQAFDVAESPQAAVKAMRLQASDCAIHSSSPAPRHLPQASPVVFLVKLLYDALEHLGRAIRQRCQPSSPLHPGIKREDFVRVAVLSACTGRFTFESEEKIQTHQFGCYRLFPRAIL